VSVDVREISLHDAVKLIVDNRGKTVPTADNGIPLIATNCIKNNGLFPVFEKIRFVSEETYKTWFRSHPEPGDIIFVNKGTPGRVCLVPNPVNFCIAQDMVALRVDESVIYPKYLFAALRSDYIQNVIENMHVGTLIPHFKKSDFERLMIPVPDEVTQKYIGNLYYDLSMAIELNNQINKNLEEMAQAIFKSWFVDFEPFKDGEFEESELGLIPKGWRVAALDEIATYLNGLAMQKYPPSKNERGLPVLKIKELRQGFTDGNSDICSESIDNSYIINDGDIIFSWSGSLLVDIWCGGRCGLNQHLFKVTSASYNKWFYYMWTRYHLERFIAIAKDKATTMGHIQRKHLSEAKVLIPEPNTLAFMDSVMQPIIDLVIANKVENKTLSTIRDTLLPKLMSGEIRVPVGEVM
jgi:type I restriction enzyme S subunit